MIEQGDNEGAGIEPSCRGTHAWRDNNPGDLKSGYGSIFQAASDGSPYFNYDIYQMGLDVGHLENLGNWARVRVRPSADGKTAIFLKWNVEAED
ncbi:MAG TPA: hypothetical protein VKY85_14695 [Candidatus Angelobacter sp.]|nr:hypothetical protein [Candidatus Angelobacter sp.]